MPRSVRNASLVVSAIVIFVVACACGYGNSYGGGSGSFSGSYNPPSPPPSSPPPPLVHPQFDEPAVSSATPPPPILGGTLATIGSSYAVASDPDFDRVHVVDLAAGTVWTLPLESGAEPGRVVAIGPTTAAVVLRRGGAVLQLDAAAETFTRISVCPAPRGIAYAANRIYVACADGDVWTLADGSTAPVRIDHIDGGDLRDVVVYEGRVFVTRFRSAELVALSDHETWRPASTTTRVGLFEPDVAWRTVVGRAGIVMVHQRALAGDIASALSATTAPPSMPSVPAYYGGQAATPSQCDTSIVHGTVSIFDGSGDPAPGPEIPRGVVAVDIAAHPQFGDYALAVAGNTLIPGAPTVITVIARALTDGQSCAIASASTALIGTAIAVAFASDGTLYAQTRAPAALVRIDPAPIHTLLFGDSARDTGHDIFHSNSGANIACASCHPEGGDDGRVWHLPEGARRTQNLRGGILATAPFHWSGDKPDFGHLTADIFTTRMSGPALTSSQVDALAHWVDSLPALPQTPPSDPTSAQRGDWIFHDPSVGCALCHSDAMFTNNQTVDVGTGAPFQVPMLVGVRWRAPYLHDGRAATLHDRFDPSLGGGDFHGHTSHLSPSQLDDLVAYLETL